MLSSMLLAIIFSNSSKGILLLIDMLSNTSNQSVSSAPTDVFKTDLVLVSLVRHVVSFDEIAMFQISYS
jgi:hypothetical protein